MAYVGLLSTLFSAPNMLPEITFSQEMKAYMASIVAKVLFFFFWVIEEVNHHLK